MLTSVLVSLVFGLFAVLVISIKKRYAYWKDRGIFYIQPKFPIGNLSGVGKNIHIFEQVRNLYLKYKDHKPFIGIFFLTQPMAVITDLNLAKDILVKDFNSFHDRPTYYNKRDDPTSAHILFMDGISWRNNRKQLTPVFTANKIRNMAPFVFNTAKKLESVMLRKVDKTGSDMDVKDIVSRYTTDIIGSCAFGFECNTLENFDTEFRSCTKHISEKPRHSPIIRTLLAIYPHIGNALKIKANTDKSAKFVLDFVKKAVEYREQNNVQRNDFLGLMIRLKNDFSSDLPPLSLEEIAAEAFLFIVAGFETSSAAIGSALYELALNPSIQERARENVHEILAKHNGMISYDAIKDMTYINNVIQETLRMHPSIGHLIRIATKDYQISDSIHKLQKGTLIFIPMFGYHMDPEVWPNPEKFDPSRFDKENIENRHSSSYLPFGMGPRDCIGARFGKLQVNAALVILLRSFKFSVCDKTRIPIKLVPHAITACADGGIWLRVDKIQIE